MLCRGGVPRLSLPWQIRHVSISLKGRSPLSWEKWGAWQDAQLASCRIGLCGTFTVASFLATLSWHSRQSSGIFFLRSLETEEPWGLWHAVQGPFLTGGWTARASFRDLPKSAWHLRHRLRTGTSIRPFAAASWGSWHLLQAPTAT